MRPVVLVVCAPLVLGVWSCTQNPQGSARQEADDAAPNPIPSRPGASQNGGARAAESSEALGPDASAPATDDGGEATEEGYPLHGVVFHFLAQVFAEPSLESPVVGAMRRGAQFRASERVDGTDCEEGWYEVPGGGYVCRGRGFILGRTPQTFDPSPMPPSLEDPLPYPYAWVARDRVAQYWRIPTPEEQDAVAAWLAAHPAAGADGGVVGTGEADTGAVPDASVRRPDGGGPDGGDADGGDGPPDVVRLIMNRGFYVSVDVEEDADDGRRFIRTIRGTYVRADALVPVTTTPTPGVRLGAGHGLPLAIVDRDGPTRWRIDPSTASLVPAGRFDRFASFPLWDVREDGDRAFAIGTSGSIVRAEAVRIARRRDRPSRIPEGARWIDVNLSEQTLVAYDGDRPVYATLVSTGKPDFETPTGLYQIQSKYVTTTMDDLVAEEPYLIEDVPWVMYFQNSYALHGAFWHKSFGHVHSHGCINLAPSDAQWLFRWTTPTLPPAWHAVLSRAGREGTYVFIEN